MLKVSSVSSDTPMQSLLPLTHLPDFTQALQQVQCLYPLCTWTYWEVFEGCHSGHTDRKDHVCYTCMVGILKCCGEEPHRVGYQKRQATYQAILKMHILLLKVWNQNFLTAFGTTATMFFISYLPPEKDIHYNLRQRSHSLTLPSEDNSLIRKNFIHRMLFRDIY